MLKDTVITELQNAKAENIVCIDLRGIDGAISEFFIICHGNSSTHVEGIYKVVSKNVEELTKQKPWHEEGVSNASWILLDYVNVIVHIFQEEERSFYALEQLWADAPKEVLESINN